MLVCNNSKCAFKDKCMTYQLRNEEGAEVITPVAPKIAGTCPYYFEDNEEFVDRLINKIADEQLRFSA